MNSFCCAWTREVRPLALSCVDKKFLHLVEIKGKKEHFTDEEAEYVNGVINSTCDIVGMKMVNDSIMLIDDAVDLGDFEKANDYATELLGYLSDPAYFRKYFKGDSNNDEWIKLDKLRHALHRLTVIYQLVGY